MRCDDERHAAKFCDGELGWPISAAAALLASRRGPRPGEPGTARKDPSPGGAKELPGYNKLIAGAGAVPVRPPDHWPDRPDDAPGARDGAHFLHSMGDTFALMRTLCPAPRSPATPGKRSRSAPKPGSSTPGSTNPPHVSGGKNQCQPMTDGTFPATTHGPGSSARARPRSSRSPWPHAPPRPRAAPVPPHRHRPRPAAAVPPLLLPAPAQHSTRRPRCYALAPRGCIAWVNQVWASSPRQLSYHR